MNYSEAIALHVTEAYEGNSWSDVCVKDIVEDIQYREAVAITAASTNTMASILHHIMFYNKAICQRLRGEEPYINDANGFDLPPLKNENDWKRLINDAMDAASEMAEAIRKFPQEKLFEENPVGKGTFYKKFHGVIEHNYYHLGQIMILKKLIRSTQ